MPMCEHCCDEVPLNMRGVPNGFDGEPGKPPNDADAAPGGVGGNAIAVDVPRGVIASPITRSSTQISQANRTKEMDRSRTKHIEFDRCCRCRRGGHFWKANGCTKCGR